MTNEEGFDVSSVRGNPTPDEESAVLEALEELLDREQEDVGSVASTSAWTLSGRLAARRGGILDARTALGRASWRVSARLPWTGRAHNSRPGRSDSR